MRTPDGAYPELVDIAAKARRGAGAAVSPFALEAVKRVNAWLVAGSDPAARTPPPWQRRSRR